MNGKVMRQMTAIGIAMAGGSYNALSIESAPITIQPPSEFWRSVAATESAIPPAAEPSTPEPKKEKSKGPAPKPAVVESLTPEEATDRAADPKAPSGALIIKPPIRKDPPAKDDPFSPPPNPPGQ